jgi:hypothetical protein
MSTKNIKAKQLPRKVVESMIYIIREERVMLDFDLASLYGVETKQLKRSVKRNILRFPKDFMFQLTQEEGEVLRCQFGTSSWGGSRYSPFVFTEQGVAMLSSVLNSARAIEMNILIMRTFINLRKMMSSHEDLRKKIEEMESKYDQNFRVVFTALKKMMDEPKKPKRKIGFK